MKNGRVSSRYLDYGRFHDGWIAWTTDYSTEEFYKVVIRSIHSDLYRYTRTNWGEISILKGDKHRKPTATWKALIFRSNDTPQCLPPKPLAVQRQRLLLPCHHQHRVSSCGRPLRYYYPSVSLHWPITTVNYSHLLYLHHRRGPPPPPTRRSLRRIIVVYWKWTPLTRHHLLPPPPPP